jgi:hypothetical protein
MITLKQHASRSIFIFIRIWKMFLKVKYYEVNNGRNLHIAYGIYNPRKLPKRGQNILYMHMYMITQRCEKTTSTSQGCICAHEK